MKNRNLFEVSLGTGLVAGTSGERDMDGAGVPSVVVASLIGW